MTAPYMPLFVADYLADTAHLNAVEHGAYLMLLMNYWQRGKPLPADDRKLARIARMTDAEWADARDTLSDFFTIDGDHWRHKRVEAEIEIVASKIDKAKAAGRASANARKASTEQSFNDRSTDVQPLGKARQEKTEPRIVSTQPEPREAGCAGRYDRLLETLGEAVGSHPVRLNQDTSSIQRLIDAGHDLERHILPVVREKARTSKSPIKVWGFFATVIQGNAQAPVTGPPPDTPMNARQKLASLARSLGATDDSPSRQHQADRPPRALLAAG